MKHLKSNETPFLLPGQRMTSISPMQLMILIKLMVFYL